MKIPKITSKFDAIKQVKKAFANLTQDQRILTFNLMWNGEPIQKMPLINRLANRMPGKVYNKIYYLLEDFLKRYKDKNLEAQDIIELKKELTNFYKHDKFTIRSRHLTLDMRLYYPKFSERLQKIFVNVLNKNYNDSDYEFMDVDIKRDLKHCEEWEKQRFMKEFGII